MINAGNAFGERGVAGEKSAELICKAYQKIGYDALALGPKDFQLHLKFLDKISKEVSFPLICANLVDRQGKLHYQSHCIVKRREKRILITSVIDPLLLKRLGLAGFTLRNPVNSIREVLKLYPHDFSIVAIQGDKSTCENIINEVPGIDLAILGYKGGAINPALIVGSTLLVANNLKGKVVSYIDFSSRKSIITPGPIQSVSLSIKKVKPDMEIERMVADYNRWARTYHSRLLNRRKVAAIRGTSQFYMGQAWCVRCHRETVDSWQKTRHAHAIESLIKKKKEYDPKCLPCHVTGFDNNKKKAGGFLSIDLTPYLVGVQCEACHGQATFHTRDPKKNSLPRVTEKTCRKCHNRETSPHFHYKEALRKGVHALQRKVSKDLRSYSGDK